MRAVGLVLISISAWGQAPPTFDAVSVKDLGSVLPMRFTPGERPRMMDIIQPFRYTPGRVTCSLPLRSIVAEAFALRVWQIYGPGWLDDPEFYQIAATMPPDTRRDEAQLMLRAMLVERFGLRFHYGKKPTSVYALVVDKGGAILQVAAANSRPYDYGLGSGELHATSMTMSRLASILNGAADRPVIDATGLTATYQFDLKWTPDPEDIVFPAPGILHAVRRLGLRLEKRTIPYQTVVIDQLAQAPTEK